MIAKISGIIDSINEESAIINVNDIGFLVFCSHKTIAEFKTIKQQSPNLKISLIIEVVIKEGAIEFYGFTNQSDKSWFLELNKVQGVGAKMALKILSHLTIEELAKALISKDSLIFQKISGIGNKLAARIITELKDSPKKLSFDNIDISDNYIQENDLDGSKIISDAVSALENLGYRKFDIIKIVNYINKNHTNLTLENLITLSLRELSRNRL